ncbi:MAG: coenzyme F420-0:L-glutamate ligase [Chloroflexota bacterium]
MNPINLIPIPNIPLIEPDDDLAQIIVETMQRNTQSFEDGDILVLAQKIVSKAENRYARLSEVTPSAKAIELAQKTEKDPQEVEVILWDTAEVIRAIPGVLIVEHKLGCISANAGVDKSNIPNEEGLLLRLPADPDQSAQQIRAGLAEQTGKRPPVMIIDSHNRPWRLGVMGVTIGISGLNPIQDFRGDTDMFGRVLKVSEVNIADQIATAALLVMGETDQACPAVIVRGLSYEADDQATAKQTLRDKSRDLFR